MKLLRKTLPFILVCAMSLGILTACGGSSSSSDSESKYVKLVNAALASAYKDENTVASVKESEQLTKLAEQEAALYAKYVSSDTENADEINSKVDEESEKLVYPENTGLCYSGFDIPGATDEQCAEDLMKYINYMKEIGDDSGTLTFTSIGVARVTDVYIPWDEEYSDKVSGWIVIYSYTK